MKKLARSSLLLLLALYACVCTAGNWIAAPNGSIPDLPRRLEGAHWIASGSRAPARVVYVFTDPDCPFCNELWKALRTAHAPQVQTRYLLVAVISPDSRGKDAAILEAADPRSAFEKHERAFDSGGLAPKPVASPATSATISENEALMKALHIFGTPGVVYFDERGEAKVFAGMPDAQQLRVILGTR